MGEVSVISNLSFEKISCVCVTRNRARLLKKSIECFKRQTYSNKELVILYYSNDKETKELAELNDLENVFFHEYNVEECLSLGELRNKCIKLTSGKFVCVWDDDDWYSQDRLIKQYCRLLNKDEAACLLRRLVIYDYETDDMFLTAIRSEGWEGSMLCKKDSLIEHPYGDMDRHEDTYMLTSLVKSGLVLSIDDPTIYVYFFHANNTSKREHLELMKEYGERLLEHQENILRNHIKDYIEDYKLVKNV